MNHIFISHLYTRPILRAVALVFRLMELRSLPKAKQKVITERMQT